ncbi:class I SAM-dependent methyltransferase [Clostridium sardiniense]|uniref:Class I SAM-dependent methyltransferase n=1 Tax=Clostridium sardiniense TaxID=29369 RepID=A0ABS7KZ49_CLOSR|nr:class I SAM-dependent methyltransferase [Clostridium sardiniense]MBY0756091.1 class I SAM-dependent methyltransferase [Clostridium sardiniense]MDQ0458966.1 tRNA (adenine22-N1)-methyltransferase [Clostridium sardiniense]
MELSKRLSLIVDHIEECDTLVDVGTDHGYIPIYAVKNGICKNAIASDINKDPLDKAKLNSIFEGVDENIDTRLGGGLETIKLGEAQVAIIAGMGGNLIRDILEADKDKVKELEFMVLQPAQNPEVLREYLYTNGYEVIAEDLCIDEDKYYELFKVKAKVGEETELDPIYYEISPKLLRDRHPLMGEYIEAKKEKYEKILSFIEDDTESALNRKKELEEKIAILTNLENYCN